MSELTKQIETLADKINITKKAILYIPRKNKNTAKKELKQLENHYSITFDKLFKTI